MARFNEILAGRFNRGLQKLFGHKGEVPAPQLATEIMPTFDLVQGVDASYLFSWAEFRRGPFLAASAANNNGVRLRNPSGSGVIGVVEFLMALSAAGDQVTWTFGQATADLASVLAASPIDTRDGRQAGNLVLSSAQTAGIALLTNSQNLASAIVAAGVPIQLINSPNQEIPILPGNALQVANTTVNVASQFVFWWRERALEDSEVK